MIAVLILVILALILWVLFAISRSKDRNRKTKFSRVTDRNFVSVLPDRKLHQSANLKKKKLIEQKKWKNLVKKGIIKDATLSKLKITVDHTEDSTLDNNLKVYIIFLKFDNFSEYSKKIRVAEAQYVSRNRKQTEQNVQPTGQLIEKGILKPNTSSKAGLVFDKTELVEIRPNDLLYFTLRLPEEGKEFTFHYKNKKSHWNLQKAISKEIGI